MKYIYVKLSDIETIEKLGDKESIGKFTKNGDEYYIYENTKLAFNDSNLDYGNKFYI